MDFRELFFDLLLVILCILTVVYLFKNYKQLTHTHKLVAFLPSFSGVIFMLLIFGHMYVRALNDRSATAFEAYTDTDDASLRFDFKKSGHLKGELIDKFSSKYYWGSYRKAGDTVTVDIKTDFPLGRTAVMKKDTLYFIDNSLVLTVQ